MFLFAGAVALTALIYAFFITNKKYGEEYSARLQAFAIQHGYSFSPIDNGEQLARLSKFELFLEGQAHRITNILFIGIDSGILNIFQDSYWIRLNLVRHTVGIIHSRKLNLPEFLLEPNWILPIDHSGADIVSSLDFLSEYTLRGTDTARLRCLFDDELVSFFEKNHGLRVEGFENNLLVQRSKKLLEVEELPAFLDLCQEVYQLLLKRQRAS